MITIFDPEPVLEPAVDDPFAEVDEILAQVKLVETVSRCNRIVDSAIYRDFYSKGGVFGGSNVIPVFNKHIVIPIDFGIDYGKAVGGYSSQHEFIIPNRKRIARIISC